MTAEHVAPERDAASLEGRRPRLLDLFCGAGGCSVGYHRAGFDVTGVDRSPQPNYPYRFWQLDVLALEPWVLSGFDAIHASPPCQAHSTIGKQARSRDATLEHPDLIAPTRDLLRASGRLYVMENVVGAPLLEPVQICGSSVGLDVRRHRLFECNWSPLVPPCQHGAQYRRFRSLDSRRNLVSATVPVHGGKQLASVVGVHGALNYAGERALREQAMGIGWMSTRELAQAIPPAYTELLGAQLLTTLERPSDRRPPGAIAPPPSPGNSSGAAHRDGPSTDVSSCAP